MDDSQWRKFKSVKSKLVKLTRIELVSLFTGWRPWFHAMSVRSWQAPCRFTLTTVDSRCRSISQGKLGVHSHEHTHRRAHGHNHVSILRQPLTLSYLSWGVFANLISNTRVLKSLNSSCDRICSPSSSHMVHRKYIEQSRYQDHGWEFPKFRNPHFWFVTSYCGAVGLGNIASGAPSRMEANKKQLGKLGRKRVETGWQFQPEMGP